MTSEPPSIAVIADAHFHDIFADYGIAGVTVNNRAAALRPFANTVRSTRVFNESSAALRYTLDDIAARGIRHVVLLGDYSDDGQTATMTGLRNLLDDCTSRFGMQFYAVPGNHDIFGPGGRHRSKRFLNARGGHDLVTSNPAYRSVPDDDTVIINESLHCAGYPLGLQSLGDVGFWKTAISTLGNPFRH
ncbi:metallophosphoesterase [Ochrobactrum grignonense]|nr:metallophosphoesterase [Brucella grignonensis]